MANILVVDDEKSIRNTLSRFLKEEEYKVSVAEDVEEARKLIAGQFFDIILSDIILPKTTGVELLRTLANDSPDSLVIMMTGEPTLGTATESLRLGAFDYLVKPIGKDRVLHAVGNAMRVRTLNAGKAKLEEQNREYQENLEYLVTKKTDALRKSEANYRDLYDNAPDMYVSVDVKTAKIIKCNKTLQTMLGYTEDEIIGHEIFEMYHDRCMPDVQSNFKQFASTGEIRDAELQLKRKDGSPLDVSLNVSAVRDTDGNVLYSRSVWRDISKRKKAEEQIRKLSQSVEHSPACVLITDHDGIINYVNPKFEQLTGYKSSEVLGKNSSILNSGIQSPEFYQEMWQTINSGKEWRGEFCNRKKNGDLYWEFASISAIHNPDGSIGSFIGVKEDITERKCAELLADEHNLVQSVLANLLSIGLEPISLETQLEKALDQILLIPWLATMKKVCIFLTDEEGVLRLRAQRGLQNELKLECAAVAFGECLCGMAAKTQQVVYKPCLDPDHSKFCGDVGDHGHYCIPMISGGKVLGVLNVLLNPEHERSQIEEETCTTIANTLAGIIERKNTERKLVESHNELVVAHDQLKQQQAQLVHSEKMASLGTLAAGVAHEINNPVGYVLSNLGTLKNYIGVLQRLLAEYAKLDNAMQHGNVDGVQAISTGIQQIREGEDLEYILGDIGQLMSESQEGAERVRDIVSDLRSYAHAGDKKKELADVNEGIESALKIVWNELKYKCKIEKRLMPLPQLMCQLGELQQVFANLLINASQAIDEHGEITIESKATEQEILIRVSDTGEGILPENLTRVFDPFFTTKEVGSGTGLGLSISHSIIDRHGGRIEVESEVGKGTIFAIHLPVEGAQSAG